MIKSFITLSFFLLVSCNDPHNHKIQKSADYVLVEFAAKLEENYHQLQEHDGKEKAKQKKAQAAQKAQENSTNKPKK